MDPPLQSLQGRPTATVVLEGKGFQAGQVRFVGGEEVGDRVKSQYENLNGWAETCSLGK
jgi:hypothetical protein